MPGVQHMESGSFMYSMFVSGRLYSNPVIPACPVIGIFQLPGLQAMKTPFVNCPTCSAHFYIRLHVSKKILDINECIFCFLNALQILFSTLWFV